MHDFRNPPSNGEFGCRPQAAGSRKVFRRVAFLAPRGLVRALLISIPVLVAPGARAQLILERTVAVGVTIPDRGQVVSTFVWTDAGLNSISRVSVDLNLSSPSVTNPMWLGDMYGSLTHGTALTGARTVTLFDFPQADPNNGATSLSASYSTTGLNGSWLSADTWSLLVADRETGGVGRLDSWKIRVEGEAKSGGTIAVHSGGTLLLGAANQISDSTQVTMAGGTVALAGYNETAGKLTVTADSVFDFGTAAGGTNTFTFSDFDTAGYGGVAGLTLSNVGIGSKLVFNTDYSTNATFNDFSSKLSFSDATLRSQISFDGGQTTLTVSAIPDARVATAAGLLCLLIGGVELRRRREPRWR